MCLMDKKIYLFLIFINPFFIDTALTAKQNSEPLPVT